MAETYSRLFPQKYLDTFLENDSRLDGRPHSEYRQISINHNPLPACDGSALVMIGDSSAICAITLEVGVPPLEEPTYGRLRIGLTLPTTAGDHVSTTHRAKIDEETRYIVENIHQLLSKHSLLDLSQLKITEGKASWVVYADITVINHDGNLFDLSLLALQTALRNTRLPMVVVQDGVKVEIIDDRTLSTPLILHRAIYPCTFGVIRNTPVVDPSFAEDHHVLSYVHIMYDENSAICGMFKPGGAIVKLSQIQTMMTLAASHCGGLSRLLQLEDIGIGDTSSSSKKEVV